MNVLPIKQVGESQRRTSEWQIEPEAKVMQGHFGGQARLKAVQGMRPLPSEPEGIEQLIVSGFNQSRAARPASAASLWTSAGWECVARQKRFQPAGGRCHWLEQSRSR